MHCVSKQDLKRRRICSIMSNLVSLAVMLRLVQNANGLQHCRGRDVRHVMHILSQAFLTQNLTQLNKKNCTNQTAVLSSVGLNHLRKTDVFTPMYCIKAQMQEKGFSKKVLPSVCATLKAKLIKRSKCDQKQTKPCPSSCSSPKRHWCRDMHSVTYRSSHCLSAPYLSHRLFMSNLHSNKRHRESRKRKMSSDTQKTLMILMQVKGNVIKREREMLHGKGRAGKEKNK